MRCGPGGMMLADVPVNSGNGGGVSVSATIRMGIG